MKRIALLLVGVLTLFGTLQAKKSLAALEENVARNPKNAKALYQLTRRYCEEDSTIQAIEAYKQLADLDPDLADDVFLRTHVAIYLGVEPFFPQPLSDSIAQMPRFSVDGKQITFYTIVGGRMNIAAIDFSGENFRLVTDDDRVNMHPCFAGSTDKFLYIRNSDQPINGGEGEDLVPEGYERELVYHNLEGGDPQVVFSGLVPIPESPDYYSDDLPVVFSYVSLDTRSYELGYYDLQESEFTELTNNHYAERHPRYSSDGKLIVHTSDWTLNEDIYIMDTQGKIKERVTTWPGTDQRPDFGDNDRKVAFVSDRNGGGQFDVFVYDRHSKEVIPVTFSEGNEDGVDLSDDGNWLIFHSVRDDQRPRLYVVSLNQPISRERLLEEISAQGK